MALDLATMATGLEQDLAEYQHHIQEMVTNGYTNNDIVADLTRRGLKVSERTLKRLLQVWGIQRVNGTPGVKTGGATDALAEAVNFIFHHTTLNDDAIAARILTDYNLHTTGRQVRSIRSDFGWLRARSRARKATQTAMVLHQVENVILNGLARTFSRRWFITYLRQQFSFRVG